MKIKVQDAGPCRKVLEIDAPASETTETYSESLKAIAKVALVTGFRKGKAPIPLVEKRFSKEIQEETRDRLVPSLYHQALEKEGIHPVAIVQVENVNYTPDKGIGFKVTVDVPPDFKLPKYKKISLKNQPVEVKEEEVEKAFQRMLDSRSRFQDVEGRDVRDQDLVQVDYAGTCDGQPVGAVAADCAGLGEGKDAWVFIGSNEFLPGFNKGLIGARVAPEARTFDVTFPADYHVKAMAGKQARYQVTVKKIREKIRPEINADFLKVFNVETVEALRDKIRDELKQDGAAREQARLKESMAKELLEKTPFELPQSILEQEVRMTIRDIVQENTMRGVSQQEIEEHKDDILQSATKTSEDRVRLSYILTRIADDEKVDVTEDELTERMNRLAVRYRMEPAAFRAEVEKRDRLESIRSDIRTEKTLDLLVAGAIAQN